LKGGENVKKLKTRKNKVNDGEGDPTRKSNKKLRRKANE